MSSRGKGFPKETQNDMLPTSSAEQLLSEAISLADELSRAAYAGKCPRTPEMPELEQIAEDAIREGYYCLGDLMDALVPERAQ